VLLAVTYGGIGVGLGVLMGGGSAWITAAAMLAASLAFRPVPGRTSTAAAPRTLQ